MTWTLLRLADAAPQPWRNGGGRTRELLAWPRPDAWTLRVSVADIEGAGPFSRFPGLERWFAVLAGDGVRLDLDGQAVLLDVNSPPLRFSGDSAVHASPLGGATQDLNLMARPGVARMRRVAGRARMHPQAGRLLAVYAHSAPVRLACGAVQCDVPAATLAWCRHEGGAVELSCDNALWMEAKA